MGIIATRCARLATRRDHRLSRMVRIIFVAPFGLGQKTTVWARILPLARELVGQGHTVSVVIPPWDTPVDAGKHWVDQGVQVINVTLAGGLPATLARLVRQLDVLQPQIVHIVKPRAHAGLVQWILWQRRRLRGHGPRILLDIDDWEQAWAAINHYHPLVARFLAWQEEWGIRHADGISAASHWLMARAQHYAPQTPVCYLPNGVLPLPDADVAEPNSTAIPTPGDTEQVLFFSRYVEVEPAWLAEFWCALSSLRPAAKLTIFGDPLAPARLPLFQQIMATACPAAVDQVTWLAYDAALLQTLYAQAACAIFPSSKTPLHEAKCSVRLATTLLHGVPVVASAVGEQAYYGAAGAAHLVPADATPLEFGNAVAQVLTTPLLRTDLRERAQQHLLETYKWERLGTQLGNFYAQAVSGF